MRYVVAREAGAQERILQAMGAIRAESDSDRGEDGSNGDPASG
jgi:hypothetical protein